MNAYKNGFWIFVLIPFLCVTCGKKKMAWEDVKRINQYNIYTQYLKENPGTKFKKEIEEALESIKQQWLPEMRDVKSMAVEIEEELPEGANFSESRDAIKQSLKEIVEDMGFEFIEFNKPADAIIKVTILGSPISGSYDNLGGSRLSGAEVSGYIWMTIMNQSTTGMRFYGKRSPHEFIGEGEFKNLSDVPFNEAMFNSNFPVAGYALLTNLLRTKLQIIHYQPHEIRFQESEKGFVNIEKADRLLNMDRNMKQKLISEDKQGSILEFEQKNRYNSIDNYLYARDKEGGSLLWKFKTKENIRFFPYKADNNVYVCTDHTLYAINPENGSLRWKLDKMDFFKQDPIFLKNTVYIDIGNRYIYAVDAESGIVKWKFRPAMKNSILNLQLSTDCTDTIICVTSPF